MDRHLRLVWRFEGTDRSQRAVASAGGMRSIYSGHLGCHAGAHGLSDDVGAETKRGPPWLDMAIGDAETKGSFLSFVLDCLIRATS